MNYRSMFATLTLLALLGGCASQDMDASLSTDTTPTTGAVSTKSDPPATGGWVEGEPEWSEGDYEMADTASAPMGAPEATAAASDGGAVTDEAYTPPPVNASPLRAGSVDDNEDFEAFVDYLARINELGVVTRPFDPTGRIVVTAVQPGGLPAAGIEVSVAGADGVALATVRTTANGTARFLPALYGPVQENYTFTVVTAADAQDAETDGEVVTAASAPGGVVNLTLPQDIAKSEHVAVDVLFLLDATGSMGDEIDRLRTTIDSVAGRIADLDTRPDVRFGMTLYRDVEDSFVTSTYDFTSSVADFRSALSGVTAEGGGDYPEALDEGLAEALATPSWRDPAHTIQLVFLVADAPAQVSRQVDRDYVESITDAVSRGITIIPVASSESDDQAEAVFRQLAVATGARFVFLSNGVAGAATGPSTDIDSTDYEELALDDLIVRLVSEQLAALTGTAPVEAGPDATDPPTSTTNPEGQ